METVEELESFLKAALANNIWGDLPDRATAWSMMRVNGQAPENIYFGETIATDLAEYGFSVLRAALLLTELQGDRVLSQTAFNTAGKSFESLVLNTSAEDENIGFFRIIGAACYHLAGYSAIAYSILSKGIQQNENSAPCEIALAYLILRDLDTLRNFIRARLTEPQYSDLSLNYQLQLDEIEMEDAIEVIINNSICKGLAFYDFALETGNIALFQRSQNIFRGAVKLAADASVVTLWWVAKLAANLTDDLWRATLHSTLPVDPPHNGEELYSNLRELFITELYGRKIAEIELWPSQLEAAARSADLDDDLIIALPTSAGKTRIAEIAALMTLSTKKRVLIVTPLRALSAQTERSFKKTFFPLGFSVSSLYGASGISAFDEDAIKSRSIVITTPEKLDFALRNDATILDDIGLIVLDEGHMIGKSEREIRYEILVQRLLKRSDAADRRIVCLSAILPDGDNLNDLTQWMRSDSPGNPVKLGWRPTRQLFGTLDWKGESATLNYDHKKEQPFILSFVSQNLPIKQTEVRPKSMHDLTVYAAWEFAKQDKKTLIFVSQANWVEKFGLVAMELVAKGYLPNLLKKPDLIARCVEVGKEWLGSTHPAVKCLEIGIAIHHGNLPDQFLREVEMLIATDAITVTIASPTLSQGLNINAAVLLVPYLHRSGELLKGEEFANVAGRAGRAFVDVEGLVIHVIYDQHARRKRDWNKIVSAARHRILTSGLMQVIDQALKKLSSNGAFNKDDAFEYLSNSKEAWFTKADGSLSENLSDLENDIEKLDATVLSLIEALDSDKEELPRLIDEALDGSLWARQIEQYSDKYKQAQISILSARANLIWNLTTPQSRQGHFSMGVGLDTGLALDAISDELETALDKADLAALSGDRLELINALLDLGGHLFKIQPFKPNALSEDWEELLEAWVAGHDIDLIGPSNMPIIEDLFSYRLVWALEALRMRRLSFGWQPEFITGGAAGCIENGVPNFMAAMLIRAGLPSRRTAMLAIKKGDADFSDRNGMHEWLKRDEIEKFSQRTDWPSAATASLWSRFHSEILKPEQKKWRKSEFNNKRLDFEKSKKIENGLYRFEIDDEQNAWISTPDFIRSAQFKKKVMETGKGITYVKITEEKEFPTIIRFGEGRLEWQ